MLRDGRFAASSARGREKAARPEKLSILLSKTNLSPLENPAVQSAHLAQSRASSIAASKAEQGAAALILAAALERREAQGSSQEPARPGTPTPLNTWVPESWRVDTGRSQGR